MRVLYIKNLSGALSLAPTGLCTGHAREVAHSAPRPPAVMDTPTKAKVACPKGFGFFSQLIIFPEFFKYFSRMSGIGKYDYQTVLFKHYSACGIAFR